MNAISVTANMTTLTNKPRALLPVNELLAGQGRAMPHRARPALVRKPLRAVARPVAKRTWVSPLSETFTEKLLYGALALAAVAGIAYSVLTVLERAQNWPIFNAWVGRILGA
jgi:hypothetical protein